MSKSDPGTWVFVVLNVATLAGFVSWNLALMPVPADDRSRAFFLYRLVVIVAHMTVTLVTLAMLVLSPVVGSVAAFGCAVVGWGSVLASEWWLARRIRLRMAEDQRAADLFARSLVR